MRPAAAAAAGGSPPWMQWSADRVLGSSCCLLLAALASASHQLGIDQSSCPARGKEWPRAEQRRNWYHNKGKIVTQQKRLLQKRALRALCRATSRCRGGCAELTRGARAAVTFLFAERGYQPRKQ